ncbi:sensor histidine kinase [Virgisporangium aurantiacum]|uniref:sensor histidine kinase n=1 Tax=Virgisporangium aurantiacum TaxID=175570 RepID=UPI00195086A1|nr:ATP-binding protein [Virgisporangium aurantiacum]
MPIQRTTARISVGMKVAVVLASIALTPLAVLPPVTWRSLLISLAALAGWTAVYSRVALRRGLTPWLVGGDLAFTAGVCLLIGKLVPVHQITAGSSWVAVLLSVCIISVGLAWPWWASVPAGFAVVMTYVIGSGVSRAPDGGAAHGVVGATQVVAVAAVMVLVRRARRTADAAFRAECDLRRGATLETERRADERRQLRLLHDTALSTLTMVAAGAIDRSSTRLRTWASCDLETLRGFVEEWPDGAVSLDDQLRDMIEALPAGIRVRQCMERCVVPGPVCAAFVFAGREALINAARHAGVDDADLTLIHVDGLVRLVVEDRGAGFDPLAVPAHRHGIRSSITERLLDVGGTATLTGGPGKGTRWTLEWEDG